MDNLMQATQKVAAAWSRSNLPPSELDTMFRSVESIYKANRFLLSVRRPYPYHYVNLMFL